MLVNFLEVCDACHSAGLEFVTIVSEMVCNNAKILKHIGVSEGHPFFRFHDREIAAINHPPCLRKCTCNLALKHDVATV
jgi:hypothetical protein